MKYEYWQCQKCGEPIGLLGRWLTAVFGSVFHKCPTDKEAA